MGVPKFILRKLYVKGSLTNVDLNNDGTYDGFKFILKNGLGSATILPEPPVVRVDGKSIEYDKITIKIDDKELKVSEIKEPIDFSKGKSMEIFIAYAGGLPAGEHKLEFEAKTKKYGKIAFDFKDKIA